MKNVSKLILLFLAILSQVSAAVVVGRIVVGPNTTSPYYAAWVSQAIAAMRASDSYPTQSAVSPTSVEFLGDDQLDPRHLVSSSAANPSWKAMFPPPVGFGSATGTCLWLFMSVESESGGNGLTLSSVTGNTSSSDANLNTSGNSFGDYSGSMGVTEAGQVVLNGSSTIPVKKLYFGFKLKSFLATSQASADGIVGYVNNASNYWVRFGVSGFDGSTPWSFSKTLNTKNRPTYAGVGIETRQDGGGFVIVGPSNDLTVILEVSNDLTQGWQSLGAYSPGNILPLHRHPDEMATFYRLRYTP